MAISTTLIAASTFSRDMRRCTRLPSPQPRERERQEQREREQPVGEHEAGDDEDDEPDSGAEKHHGRKRRAHRSLVLDAAREIHGVRAARRCRRACPSSRPRDRRRAPRRR